VDLAAGYFRSLLGLLAVSIFVAGHSLVELEKRKINA
jgi:hypothetical protein